MSNSTMSKRFSLIEIDGPAADSTSAAPVEVAPTPEPVEVAATPEPTVAPEPVRSASDGWNGPGVSMEGKARAIADEEAAAAAGFTLKPPIYEIGRLVNYVGVDNFRRSQMEFENMATVEEACGHLQETIAAEDRQDKLVQVPNLHMLDDGKLHTKGNGTYPLSRRALQGLCGFTTPGGAGYLSECPPKLRAFNLNQWFEAPQGAGSTGGGYREDRRATTAQAKDWQKEADRAERYGTTVPAEPEPVMVEKAVTLRTRNNRGADAVEGDRELFAVVGPNYGEHDVDKIAAQIMEGVPSDARCNVVYDGYKARIDILFHSNIAPEKAVAGEIFKAGVCITTADDGSGSIKISAEMWRNLCLNLYIIDNAKELITSRRHFGQGISEAVEAGIKAAQSKIAHFMNKWNEGSLENVVQRYNVENADAILRGLAYNKVVHVSGVKKADMYKRLLEAWQKEPGDDRNSFVNAVTRAAHEQPWNRWTTAEDLERLGGRLLFAKAWNVEITPEQSASLG
jgi:hypothetical protein